MELCVVCVFGCDVLSTNMEFVVDVKLVIASTCGSYFTPKNVSESVVYLFCFLTVMFDIFFTRCRHFLHHVVYCICKGSDCGNLL